MSAYKRFACPTLIGRLAMIVVVALFIGVAGTRDAVAADPQRQKSFASPEEAVQTLVEAVKTGDMETLATILGPEGRPLIASGDAVADTQERERFVRAYDQLHKLERPAETKAVIIIGQDEWPLPIPVVKEGDTWRFDTAAGKEEILNRRIGRNELNTMQVCLAYVDAQREYARVPREDDGLLTYAMKFRSDEGKKNGLYWPTKEGEELSPLGVFVANARAEGYSRKPSGDKPTPYHGYVYRILTAQGPAAPGGAHDYVVNGKMIGGFALVAYPAQYGVSGVMTFLVNYRGVIYEKDLGPDTEYVARAIQTYNPDQTWKQAGASSPPTR
ncbi:MAG: DUF2950 domain-containing protein [candidate division NC10 bacterium]|nr:DUF2950 domain-containing protein [candidate division NC10 bacterium]MDE2321164.1 DUF2950 domain-containing protein [candidate division NC10 bacterium]